MEISLARNKEKKKIEKYDSHIHSNRLGECIYNQFVYVLRDEEKIVGVLRYSFFWQTIPFLDLLYINENYRKNGYGKKMMAYWENLMGIMGYKDVMLSTQEDETSKHFYEKLNYKQIGRFLPPNQAVYELMYSKEL